MCRFCSRACEDMAALRDVPAGSPSYLLASVDGFRILSDIAPLVRHGMWVEGHGPGRRRDSPSLQRLC